MTNIEQIKKDWEEFCEEYGFKSYCKVDLEENDITEENDVYFSLRLDYRSKPIEEGFCTTYYSNTNIHGRIDNDGFIIVHMDLVHADIRHYKLFTSFYEKLIGANEDSERLINEQDND